MPWWAWIWVAVLTAATAGGALDEFRDGKPTAGVLSLLSGGVSVLGVLVHFRLPWATPALPALGPLSVAGGVWLVIETVAELGVYLRVPDSELSPGESRLAAAIAALIVVLLFAPALALGLRAGMLHWSAA